jgi:hypothetical protein
VEEVGRVQGALDLRRVEHHLGPPGFARGTHEEGGVDAGRCLSGGDRVADEATDDLMRVAEREIVAADQLVREMARRAPERSGLGGHDLAVDHECRDPFRHEPERAHARVAHRREDVVAEGVVEVGRQHRPLAAHHRREPADRLPGQCLYALEGVRILLLRHDAARPGERVRYLHEAELPGMPDEQIRGEAADVAHQQRQAGHALLHVIPREAAGVRRVDDDAVVTEQRGDACRSIGHEVPAMAAPPWALRFVRANAPSRRCRSRSRTAACRINAWPNVEGCACCEWV